MGAQSTSAQLNAIRKLLEKLDEEVEQIAIAVNEKNQSQARMQSAKRTPRR